MSHFMLHICPCQFLDTYPPMYMKILRNLCKRMCIVSISWHLHKPTQSNRVHVKYWYILYIQNEYKIYQATKSKQPIVNYLTGWWGLMCQKDDAHDEDLGLILQGLIYISLSLWERYILRWGFWNDTNERLSWILWRL